jgi:hypothetical protein
VTVFVTIGRPVTSSDNRIVIERLSVVDVASAEMAANEKQASNVTSVSGTANGGSESSETRTSLCRPVAVNERAQVYGLGLPARGYGERIVG